MKRIVVAAAVLLLALPFALPAQEAAGAAQTKGLESALSIGFEFGNTFEHHDSETDYFGSPGATLDGYFFWNGGKIGMFFRAALMVPVVSGDTWDFQIGWLIGPAFRAAFTERLTLQTGLGLAVNSLFASYSENDKDYLTSVFNFGIGADAGLKFDITDAFFIKAGANVSWTFLGFGVTNEKAGRWGWNGRGDRNGNPSGYWTLNVNPYISFGINIFSPKRDWKKEWEKRKSDPNRTRLGKPPRE